jgi:glyoxylase-like metal-dependent hydrolase (beta-lactamase superfamily II)
VRPMTKTKAVIVPVTPFQQNSTLLWCEVTKRAVVIDPGGDLPEVERAITRAGVSDQVQIGELTFDVLHCPGHSPGSIVYFNPVQRLAIVGEVLFAGSIGRTDLPGGDYQQLIESIKDKLLPLGDDVAIISGHGPTSTIGHERATNPFLQ